MSDARTEQEALPMADRDLHGDVSLKANVLGRLGELGVGVVILSGRRGEARENRSFTNMLEMLLSAHCDRLGIKEPADKEKKARGRSRD